MAAPAQRRFILLLTAMLYLSVVARAQSGGSVKISGGVSETVLLSIPQGAEPPGVRVTSSQNADRSLTVILSGTTHDLTKVSIPVQIRSNTAYRLLATAQARGSNLSSLLVVGARPTGNLVAADAEAVSVAGAFDGRGGANRSALAGGFDRPNLPAPLELLSGPRVSTGGTLTSPQNALEVTLSVAVEPQAGAQGWTVELLLSAAPVEHIP
jgi:hypothetical protein